MPRLSLIFLVLQLLAIPGLCAEKTQVTRSIEPDGTYTISLTYPSGKKSGSLVDMDAYQSQFEVLSELAAKGDAHPLVHVLLGQIYAEGYGCKEDRAKAMEHLSRSLLLHEDKYIRLRARLIRAWTFHRWKKYHEAYLELEQIEKLTPSWDNSALYFSLSWLGRNDGLSKSELHICNERAAQWGHTKGMLTCSTNLFLGEGVPKDYKASYSYALLTKGIGVEKDFWKGDINSLEEMINLLEKLLPPAELIKGQQEATELRKLVNERKEKQQDEMQRVYLVQTSFDEWCVKKIGADFHSAWNEKLREKIKGVEYLEPPEKK